MPECQHDARYLARMGHLLNADARHAEALEHLERALLIAPDLLDAQLDYAIALAGSGDAPSALALIDSLLARGGLPEALRLSLQQNRSRWLTPESAALTLVRPLQQRWSAGLRLGHDSNLIGAPNLSSLPLTFPNETLVFALDPGSQPRAGGYARSDLRLDLRHQSVDGSRWEISTALLQRNSPAAIEANTSQLEFQAERTQSPQTDRLGHYLNFNAASLHSHGGTRYSSLGLGVGLELRPTADCSSRLGLELQRRALFSNPLLSGRYGGLHVSWGCQPRAELLSADSGWLETPQWQVLLRLGQDQPTRAERPGGAQTQASLRSVASLRGPSLAGGLRAPSQWLLDVELSQYQDASGYSPLLDHDRLRRTTRLSARLEVQQALRHGLELVAGAEWVQQRASLLLFKLQSWGPYAALRVLW